MMNYVIVLDFCLSQVQKCHMAILWFKSSRWKEQKIKAEVSKYIDKIDMMLKMIH